MGRVAALMLEARIRRLLVVPDGMLTRGGLLGVFAMLSAADSPKGTLGGIGGAMNADTRANLLDALRGEAFAYAKYKLFAKRARQSARENLAHLFEESARVELEHFDQLAEHYRLVNDDARNLENACEPEEFEVQAMYRDLRRARPRCRRDCPRRPLRRHQARRDGLSRRLLGGVAHLESPMPS